MEKLAYLSAQINQIVWGEGVILLLLGIGLYFFIRLYRCKVLRLKVIIKESGKLLFQKGNGLSALASLSTALGATLGVGSVVGVASAIMSGGAGALFWMWVCALIGMGLKYAETVAAMKHRRRQKDGTFLGGAFYILEDHRLTFFGVLFALFCIIASFGIGNVVPVTTIVEAMAPYVSKESMMIVLLLLLGICLFFGAAFILKLNAWLVPLFSIVYGLACVYLILLHREQIPQVFWLILQDAFQPQAQVGGIFAFFSAKALHYGISRGVFSHEAGMGSAPLAHAGAAHTQIRAQGYLGVLEVFMDTMVFATLSAFVCLLCVPDHQGSAITLFTAAFESGFGMIGVLLFRFALVCFAFSSMLGWIYYAFAALRYLFPYTQSRMVYAILFLCVSVAGVFLQSDLLWEIADTCNALMMLPNLFAIWLCRKEIIAV